MTSPRIAIITSSLKRLEFAAEGRTETVVTEWHDDEPRHGIAKTQTDGGPLTVTWLPTAKLPAGAVELDPNIGGNLRDSIVAEAEDKITRSIFPGEHAGDTTLKSPPTSSR